MPSLQKRFSVLSGFLLLLVLLAANTIVIKRQLTVQEENRAWLAHSGQVILQLSRMESLLKDTETGQRGYLYTGDEHYLEPYTDARAQVMPAIDALAQITADNPRQQQHVAALRNLAQSKLEELAQTVALYRSGKPDQAKAIVLSNAGLIAMNDFRAQVDAMEQEEGSIEAARHQAFHHSVRVTVDCVYAAAVIGALAAIVLAFVILQEMDLRERHGRQMREREEWFRVTLTSLGDAVIATDEEGLVTFLNPVAERLTGWNLPLAKGKKIDEVFPIFNEYTLKPVDNPVKKVMELGSIVGLANHTVLRHADGSLRPIEDSAAPIRDDRDKLVGVVLVFRDATYERESQEILRKTEKLAAAARLAATFSHEINNPLEAVVNLIYIVKETEGLPTSAVQPLELAEHELERVSHIARQTLGFYRESKVPGRVDLPAVIENVLKLYSNKLKAKNIHVECDFDEACPTIQGLAGELTQAISNLISNAADAVAFNGLIRVSLSTAQEQETQWIKLVIEDNGPGVRPDQASRIFEPFFTTKTDVGTGLGLWVTKEIVQRHGGRIEVDSKTDDGDHGAVFTIYLPCAVEN